MLSYFVAGMCCVWLMIVLSAILSGSGGHNRGKAGVGNYWNRQMSVARRQAKIAGVSWSGAETALVWILSLTAAAVLYFATENLLLVGSGWLLSLFLPGMIIQKRKNRQRLKTLEALTDCLRQLLIRLPDQGSLSRAMEMVAERESDGEAMAIARVVLDELRLGADAKDAIGLWQRMVGLRKFDHVAQTLIQSNADGWTPVALKALEKSVEALEADLRAVRLTEQKAADRKKQLYMAIAIAWSFPLILSMMDTGQINIYLHTAAGKLLIFAYVTVSLYTAAKGQEYLSINVDEL